MKTLFVAITLVSLSAPAFANGLGVQNSSLFGNLLISSTSNGTSARAVATATPRASTVSTASTAKATTPKPVNAQTSPISAASGSLKPTASSRLSGLLGLAAAAGSTSSTR